MRNKHVMRKWVYLRLAAAVLAAAVFLCACAAHAAEPVESAAQVSLGDETAEKLPETVQQPFTQKDAVPQSPLTGLPLPDGFATDTRPVAVMVDNTAAARPQRGVAKADVVMEALCEDGQSHFMLLYADPAAVPEVGPVYSARDQFLQMALPVNAIPAYIGTTRYAENLINLYAWQDLDGVYIGTTAFRFDSARNLAYPEGKGNEYCWFTDAGLIGAGIAHTQLNPKGQTAPLFSFSQAEGVPAQAAQTVDIKFWSNSSAQLLYDAAVGRYVKNTGIGEGVHADEDGSRLEFENVLVLQCAVGRKPDGYISEYDLSAGTGWYFTKGGAMDILWEKGGPADPLKLFDAAGKELLLNTGKTYMALVAKEGEVAVGYY